MTIDISRRLAGNDPDRPSRRVAAEEGALGAAEDFDLLDIEELSQLAGWRVHVDIVVVDGH